MTPLIALASAAADAADATATAATSSAYVVLIASLSIALVVSAVCSVSESVILSVSRGQVERMAQSGSRAGRILKRWKQHDIEAPIAAVLTLNTFAHTVGATFAGSAYQEIYQGSIAAFSIIFTLVVLIFTEIIPKSLGVAQADRLAAPITMMLASVTWLLHYPLLCTSWFARLFVPESRQPVTSVEEIRLLAAIGKREGDLGPRFAEFIEGITSLRELTARDVMVPRSLIVFLSGARTNEANLEVMRESEHSRYLFTPTGELDDVNGVIIAKDLLFAENGTAANLAELKHPLLVMPESKTLDEALRMFQEQRRHLAVVVDEYGGTQGVITLEDVLEEIVGEIEDESDRIERMVIKRKDGSYLCRGRAEMRKLFRVLERDEKVEAITLAGFCSDELRRVPVAGDTFVWKKLRFRVTKATRRRAERLEVEFVPTSERPPGSLPPR
ncbi:MAG: HlyC/CorC family transporter [Myxococcales bacterium]|nr:HlyC/CorC family transporter [Myxococcales bacterium]